MIVGGSFIMVGAWIIFCEEDEDEEGNAVHVMERLDAEKVMEVHFPDEGDEERSTRTQRSARVSRTSQSAAFADYGGVESFRAIDAPADTPPFAGDDAR